jgi:hypothetical protein
MVKFAVGNTTQAVSGRSWPTSSKSSIVPNPTIGAYKLPALHMLDILDVGEASVFQLFCCLRSMTDS